VSQATSTPPKSTNDYDDKRAGKNLSAGPEHQFPLDAPNYMQQAPAPPLGHRNGSDQAVVIQQFRSKLIN